MKRWSKQVDASRAETRGRPATYIQTHLQSAGVAARLAQVRLQHDPRNTKCTAPRAPGVARFSFGCGSSEPVARRCDGLAMGERLL